MLGESVDTVDAGASSSKDVQKKDLVMVVVIGLVVIVFVVAILVATYIMQAR